MPFSVLISVYKNDVPDVFNIALNSLFNQKRVPDEIVLVVDGPVSDELKSVIDFHAQLLNIVYLDYNVGLGKALAIGLKHCKYDLVARADSDDISDLKRFEMQYDYMLKNPHVSACGMYISEFEDLTDYKSGFLRTVPCNSDDVYKYSLYRNPMNHVSVMFRKEHVLKVGSYKSFKWYEDYYLWIRLLREGYKLENIPVIGVYVNGGIEMIKRRSGLVYFKADLNFFIELYKIKYISFYIFIKNIFTRFFVRFLPKIFVKYIYINLLRQNVNNS